MKVGPRRPLAPDADVIRALAGLLSETGLSEIEYAVGDHRIRVAKESAGKTVRGERSCQRGACEWKSCQRGGAFPDGGEPRETAEPRRQTGTGCVSTIRA